MSNPSALVILYNGVKPSEYAVEQIISYLQNYGVIETTAPFVVKHFDETSLAKLTVSRTISDSLDDQPQESSKNPIEQACIYIVNRFGEFFVKSKSDDTSAKYVNFMFAVKHAVDEARSAFPRTENDKALINAIDIIGESEIPKTIRAKTGMTTIAVSIIKKIYQNGLICVGILVTKRGKLSDISLTIHITKMQSRTKERNITSKRKNISKTLS